MSIVGKVAVITGASRGIGAATALELADHGVKIVLAARSTKDLETLVNQIRHNGGEAISVKVDVASETDVASLFQEATKAFGGVDFVFSNAGVLGPVADPTNWRSEEYRQLYDVNVLGTFYVVKYGVPALKARGGGVLVFNSSAASLFPAAALSAVPTMIPYVTTKAAIDHLVRGLAAYEAFNIKSYSVNPFVFKTKMAAELVSGSGAAIPSEDALASFNPVHKEALGDPALIGRLVSTLFNGTTKYPSSASILIDGDVTWNSQDFLAVQGLAGPWQIPYAAARDIYGNPRALRAPEVSAADLN